MRVIGNNRTVDIPYEQSVIYYYGGFKQIRADYRDSGDGYILKSKVESDEAEKILSDIRNAYSMGRKYIIL